MMMDNSKTAHFSRGQITDNLVKRICIQVIKCIIFITLTFITFQKSNFKKKSVKVKSPSIFARLLGTMRLGMETRGASSKLLAWGVVEHTVVELTEEVPSWKLWT